ncbi:putative heterokaryon incompatibility Het-C protein [Venustampulla echinocandica]|uniref:Putative heterokaryon incompatibility Het-C protein n=1 Tax=Venustampulla echinocandica TaxID=2656787 RepID=A0A370TW27_9HELO|nr:putative heterokaryon incompatibility Het-C protein [Venustampulla echinocandica]RDL39719.1 putative heterokaryon incompatibility Het-C protein [Venustampulla echinocandica]
MAPPIPTLGSVILVSCLLLLVLPAPAAAFGAGNIPSIANIEGDNFRHGDIEDFLKTVAFIKGHKWTSMMIKRVYFGNWLRDYSQAIDVGSVKGVSAPTIRILVWVLSFLAFGYATEEFEVTEERLGVYRPEEHIDNPKDYADNKDARQYDPRLRGPVQNVELEIDNNTGMKNYIANENGGWATSSGYVKFSFARSIHFGRLYTSGSGNTHGKEADLCEALRCLGQGLHCMEDFGAHTNYVELALRELGHKEVFPHTGVATEINVRGHRIFPLVTGTFGAVDFLHSVLGEATDHFTQTEVEEMDLALKGAEQSQSRADGQRGFGSVQDFAGLLSQVPGAGSGLAQTARDLQTQSAAQEYENATARADAQVNTQFQAPPGSSTGPPGPGVPGMSADFDPVKTAKKIYPILEFRDKVVKAINATIAKIPGLESLVEKISETLTVFVLSLLSPFIRPIIQAVSKALKDGSSTVVNARHVEHISANQQFEPWNDPHCTNPTHSMLSKDHFSNKLNGVGGRVATTILQYVTPRLIYAWQNPGVPVDEVMNDILKAFHHPALRDESLEIHRNMFNTVRKWVEEQPDRHNLNHILSSASVKAGRNHKVSSDKGGHDHSHGSLGGHGKTSGSIWSEIRNRDLGAMEGRDDNPQSSYISSSPQPSSPGRPPQSPSFGYQNLGQPSSSQGGYLSTGYQQSYQQGGPSQGGYSAPSYQQPPYGGAPPGPQYPGHGSPPPPGPYQGPPGPGYWATQGPPPPGPGFQGGPPPGQYPPQQPPYGYPPGGYGY